MIHPSKIQISFITCLQLVIFMVCSFMTNDAFAEEKKRVTVLEFQGPDVPVQVRQSVTNAAREGALDMLPPDAFNLMTQETTRAILSDMDIDISCVEGNCEAETLRNIQADFGVTGAITKIDGEFEVVMRLFESASASLLASETATYSSISDMKAGVKHDSKLLVASIPGAGLGTSVTMANVTVKKTEVYKGDDIVNVNTGKSGFLYITSNPDGANIFINGENAGQAPVQKSVPEGDYVIVGDMGAIYHPATSNKIHVGDSETVEVPLTLSPSFGTLEINSNPKGAKVYVSGEFVGTTPYIDKRKPSGVYNVQIEQPQYFTHQERIVLEDEQTISLNPKLERSVGDIMVDSSPRGAEIWLNGAPTGDVTPQKYSNKAPGTYEIRITKDLYKARDITVQVKAGEEALIKENLGNNFGNLKVESSPKGATILINGKDTGNRTPHTFTNQHAGLLNIELHKDGYGVIRERIEIPEDGSTISFNKDLTAKLATIIVTSTDPTGKPCAGEVLLDGENIGKTPIKTQIVAIPHQLVVDCNGMRAVQQIDVAHNASQEFNMQVQTYSESDLRSAQMKLFLHRAIDWGLLGLSGSMASSGASNLSKSSDALDEASNIQSSEDAAYYQELLEDSATYMGTANTNFVVSAISGGAAAAHYILMTRKARKEVTEMKKVRAEAGL